LAFISAFFVLMIIEMMQFFVQSRYFSFEDIILGFIGISYGVISYILLHLKQNVARTRFISVFIFFSINYILFLLYKYAYPFQFYTDKAILLERLTFFFFNVKSSTPSSRPIQLLIMGAKNTILYIPGGIIIRELYYRVEGKSYRRIITALLMIFILLPKLLQPINMAQMPLLFDLLGILTGFLIGYFAWKEYREYLEEIG